MPWTEIGDFILKFWIEFLLTGIVSIGGLIIKGYNKRKKTEQEYGRKDFLKEVKKEINTEMNRSIEEEQKLQNNIDAVNNKITGLTKGILSMQRREFIHNCEDLLDDDHVMTLDEYEDIIADHEAYNGLGGNHKGDMLFDLIKEKAKNTFGHI